MRVLVMGATGHVGKAIVEGLRDHGVRVRAVSRSGQEWPDGVEGFVGDPNEADGLAGAGVGVEAAFVMSGYAAEAALLESLGDAHVVLLSASSAVLGDANPLSAMHASSEAAVEASGLPRTFLRPCSFQSNLLRWREQLDDGDVVRAPYADVPVAMSDPADIAAVAVLALTDEGHVGEVHRISGPEALTPADQLKILGDVLGRDLRLEPEPDDPEDPGASIFRDHPELESEVQPTVERLLGRPAGSLADWVQRNRDAFS